MSSEVVPGQPPRIWIDGGVVAWDPPGLACRYLFGAGDNVVLADAGAAATVEALSETAADALGLAPPRPGGFLLAELAEPLASQEALLVVDDQIVAMDSTDAVPVDRRAVLDAIVDLDRVLVADPSVSNIGAVTAPPIAAPTTTDSSNPTVSVSDVLEVAPLITIAPVDSITGPTGVFDAERRLFTTPEGEEWTVRWRAGNEDLAATLETELRASVIDGTFGVWYREQFGANPNIAELLPDLLAGRTACA
jgi:hypothetical protein